MQNGAVRNAGGRRIEIRIAGGKACDAAHRGPEPGILRHRPAANNSPNPFRRVEYWLIITYMGLKAAEKAYEDEM